MGQYDHQDEEAVCDVFSEESLSRSDSVDQLSLHQLDDGSMEERFRVDRRKLEAMILGELIRSGHCGCVCTLNARHQKLTSLAALCLCLSWER